MARESAFAAFSWAWTILLLLIDDNLWPVETILSVLQVAISVTVIFLAVLFFLNACVLLTRPWA
jgi:hypothetical protein